jgi:hypothetical protein
MDASQWLALPLDLLAMLPQEPCASDSSDRTFYTYAWLREDKTPYYIGKGKGNRAYKKCRKFRPPDNRILILKKNLTEEEAIKHEIYLIFVLGRKDAGTGILRNKTDGGDGTSGAIMPDEAKQKIGDYWRGKRRPKSHGEKISASQRGTKRKPWTPEQKEKLRNRPSPNKGKKMSEDQKQKIREAKRGVPWSEARRRAQENRLQSND